jgi:hypothetical protein
MSLNVCHDTCRPSCENKLYRLTFEALTLRRKNSLYFRKAGRNPAVVGRGMAVLQEYQRRHELFY